MSEEQKFPLLGNGSRVGSIPWWVAEQAYIVYASKYGDSQSLERLAERGGFGIEEMDEFFPEWREKASVIEQLQSRLTTVEEERNKLAKGRKGGIAAANILDDLAQKLKEITGEQNVWKSVKKLSTATATIEEYKDALATKFNAELCEALKPLRDKLVTKAATIELLEGKVGVCKWTYSGIDGDDFWDTTCGESYIFISGGIKDNRVIFCHHCGRSVEEIIPRDEPCPGQ